MPYNQIISIFFLKTESFSIFFLFGRGASGQFENKNIQLVKLDIYEDKQTRNKETADQKKNRRQDKHTYIKIDTQKNRQIDKRQLEK